MIEKNDKSYRIGLALSGGGYRAAAFHIGTFRKLGELGLLDKIDVISTISGGSIAGAYYVLNKEDFNSFETSFKANLQKSCIRRIIWTWRFWLPILIFIGVFYILFVDSFNIDLPTWATAILVILVVIFLFLFQFKIISFTSLKINAYRKIFFGKKKLSDLPENPVLAINATNLSTGTLWTFSKNKTSDSSYEFPKDGGNSITFQCDNFPLAKAVASSSSVPVPFDPVKIQKGFFKNPEDYDRVKPQLIDGGLYDNQGIHKLTQHNSSYSCDIVIVSDGSQPFSNIYKSSGTLFILYRGIDLMMRKIKNLQFIRDVYSAKKEIAYFSLDFEYSRCVVEFINAVKNGLVSPSVLEFHKLDEAMLKKPFAELTAYISDRIGLDDIIKNGLTDEEIKKISRIKTNLTALKETDIDLLSKHAEVLTEIQIKIYCPTLN